MLVTEFIVDLSHFDFIRYIPSAAAVPIRVESSAELTARISVLRRARKASSSFSSFKYHSRLKPVKLAVLSVLLKEKSISVMIGIYSTANTRQR